MVTDVKLSDLPRKLRHIWKTIAVPQPDTKSPTKTEQPIILNATSTPQTGQSTIQLKKTTKSKQSPMQKRKNTEPLHHYLSQQLHSLSQQVQQIQQSKQYRERPRTGLGRAPETCTCYNCKKT